MTIYETYTTEINGKNQTLEIHYDNHPSCPREEFEQLGTLCLWEDGSRTKENPFTYPEDIHEEINEKNAIILDVYKYDHSGAIYNTTGFSCPWDSGQVGYIYVEKEKIRKEWKVKRISSKLRKIIENNLKSEVQTWSNWVSGSVFGYILKDENGNEIDSCWGFYGDNFKENGLLDYTPDEFKEMI